MNSSEKTPTTQTLSGSDEPCPECHGQIAVTTSEFPTVWGYPTDLKANQWPIGLVCAACLGTNKLSVRTARILAGDYNPKRPTIQIRQSHWNEAQE